MGRGQEKAFQVFHGLGESGVLSSAAPARVRRSRPNSVVPGGRCASGDRVSSRPSGPEGPLDVEIQESADPSRTNSATRAAQNAAHRSRVCDRNANSHLDYGRPLPAWGSTFFSWPLCTHDLALVCHNRLDENNANVFG